MGIATRQLSLSHFLILSLNSCFILDLYLSSRLTHRAKPLKCQNAKPGSFRRMTTRNHVWDRSPSLDKIWFISCVILFFLCCTSRLFNAFYLCCNKIFGLEILFLLSSPTIRVKKESELDNIAKPDERIKRLRLVLTQ